MALHTEPHLININNRLNTVHGPNISVTASAIDGTVSVRGMIKIGILVHVIHFCPQHRSALIEMCSQFLYLRMLDDDSLVAQQTRLYRRNSGMSRLKHLIVAHDAANLFPARVYAVTKRNRLFGTQFARQIISVEQKCDQKAKACTEKQDDR